MVEVPDYSFISKDAGPSLSGSINNWLTIDKNVYDLKEKGANEAIGNILQQSTDAQGNVDYGTANALAAKAGPRVQMGMQTMLANNSARRGEQIDQGSAMYNHAARSSMSLMYDPSDANLEAVRGDLKRQWPGMSTQIDSEFDAAKAMQPAQRVQWAYRHGVGAMDASGRMKMSPYGETAGHDVGGAIVAGTTTQASPYAPGGLTIGGGGLGRTLTPGEGTALDKIDIGNGQTIQVPHESAGALLRANPGWRAIAAPGGSPISSTSPPPPPANYVARPASAAPAAPAAVPSGNPATGGTPGGPGTYQGPGFGVLPTAPGPGASLSSGGVNVASADPSFVSGVGAAAPPSPVVAGDVSAIMAGMNQARAAPQGGTQQAFNALQSGGVSGAAASTAAPPPAGPPAATPAPPQPTLGVSAPPGKVEAGQETGKQSATMGGALISRGDQAPVQKANLQNMMTDLSKLDSMGPGTDKEIFLNSVMQKLTGYGFSMNRDQVAAGNSFAKLANIAVGQQLAAIGGTDARQSLFMGSNPHLDMSKLGNERIIQMLMGNEDAIQAKARAWTTWSQSRGDDTYRQFQDDFNRHFDPRVFQSQYMARGGPELEALKQSLLKESGGKTDSGAYLKFKEDTAYARNHGWIQ
jgi:hypothetical protein